jgi:hypothetical protein
LAEASVAEPGCLSRIWDPEFFSIPDPTTTKEGGQKTKKKLLSYNFVAINFTKLVFFLSFIAYLLKQYLLTVVSKDKTS